MPLRTHSYFLRLHIAADSILRSDRFRVFAAGAAAGVISDATRAFMAEVMQYIVVHSGMAHESSDNVIGMGRAFQESTTSHLAPEEVLQLADEALVKFARTGKWGLRGIMLDVVCFMSLVTGAPWGDTIDHRCSAACGGEGCRQKVAIAFRNLLLRRLPVVPVASRWTKVGSSVDFLVSGFLAFKVLPLLFGEAFRHKKPFDQTSRSSMVPDADIDVEDFWVDF